MSSEDLTKALNEELKPILRELRERLDVISEKDALAVTTAIEKAMGISVELAVAESAAEWTRVLAGVEINMIMPPVRDSWAERYGEEE